MDIEQLMTHQGMRDFTDEQRDTFTNDATQLRQLAQIVQARLANTEIEGDRAGSASRRSRKVVRRMGKVARLLEKAAAETEAINAVYLREVLELPERRAREIERKEQRRDRLGIAASTTQAAVAKSLNKSAHAFNGTQPPVSVQVSAAQQVPQYVSAQPFQFSGAATASAQPIPNIGDFFQQEAL